MAQTSSCKIALLREELKFGKRALETRRVRVRKKVRESAQEPEITQAKSGAAEAVPPSS
jgi:hypothetical protein